MVVTTEDQLGSQRREGGQSLLRVGEPMAAGGLALYGVVVDHDYPGGARIRLREGLLGLHEVSVLDVPYNAEVPQATRERAARDAVRGVATGDHRPRYLQRRAELR